MMVINTKEVISGVDILVVLPSSREACCGGLCDVNSIQGLEWIVASQGYGAQYRTFCESAML